MTPMTPTELSNQLRDESARSMAAIRLIADQIEAIDTPSISVKVPYHSQWENGAGAFRNDCGPACVKMLLDYKQCLPLPTIDRISSAAGLISTKTGTTGSDLARAASQFGLLLEAVRGWTLDQFAAYLPAIILVHYGSVPNRIDNNYTTGHWLVIVGVSVDTVVFHDPDWWEPRLSEGANRILQRAVFAKAVQDCAIDGNPVGYGLVLV
jgi:hypothetical protein